MDPLTVGSIIAGGSSLFGTYLNIKNAQSMQNTAFQQSKEGMAIQQGYNKENMYLAPVLQAQGLRSAGINPASQGTSVSTSAPSAPNYTPPSYPQIDVSNGIQSAGNAFLNMQMQKAQIDNMNANTAKVSHDDFRAGQQMQKSFELLDSQIGLNNFDLSKMKPLQAEQLQKEIDMYKVKQDNLLASTQALKSQTNLNDKQIAVVVAKAKQLQIECSYLAREKESQISKNYADAYNARMSGSASSESVVFMQKQEKLTDAQYKTETWRTRQQKYDALQHQFEAEVKAELGVGYYKNVTVIRDILGGAKDVGVAAGGLSVAYKSLGKPTPVTKGVQNSGYTISY